MSDDIFDNLPKRDDDIYIEIENFEDYEFINCIAYEMAIRNKKVKKIAKTINRIQRFISSKTSNAIKRGKNAFDFRMESTSIEYFNNKLDELQYKLKTKYFFDYGYYQIDDKLIEEFGKDFFINDDIIDELKEEREMRLKGEDNYIKPKYNVSIKDGYIIKQKLKSDLTTENTKITTIITTNFKKQLFLPIGIDNQMTININPNLPKDEILAYISKIKDDFDDDNSIIKTPLELLGKDLTKVENEKINKILIADKFFIYDYVEARLKDINESNKYLVEEYEENKNNIINSFDRYKDKQIQLKNLKKDFKADTNVKKEELFEDIEYFTKGTAKKYYYDIKPFIDDCKYKELITGRQL